MHFEQLLSIWWSFFWRAAIAGVVCGVVLGALGGFVVGFAGFPRAAPAVGALMGWVGTIPVSFWALYATLKTHRLQPVAEDGEPQEIQEIVRREPRFDA